MVDFVRQRSIGERMADEAAFLGGIEAERDPLVDRVAQLLAAGWTEDQVRELLEREAGTGDVDLEGVVDDPDIETSDLHIRQLAGRQVNGRQSKPTMKLWDDDGNPIDEAHEVQAGHRVSGFIFT